MISTDKSDVQFGMFSGVLDTALYLVSERISQSESANESELQITMFDCIVHVCGNLILQATFILLFELIIGHLGICEGHAS